MSFFSAEGISAGYDRHQILTDISFSLEAGTITGILGANGCGKTTLLKAICGILPHAGSCTLLGHSLEALSPRKLSGLVRYIPQRSGISMDISLMDVVLMGFNPQLGLLERPGTAMKAAAEKALALVGLADRAQENYQKLSEGQKQLCILARTLSAPANLLLLDEPESALDFHFRYQMLGILRRWVEAEQRGVLLTLHDPMLALNGCQRLLLISHGQVLGMIRPRKDPLPNTQALLAQIYGKIHLQAVTDPSGRRQLVMLPEETL